MKFSKEQFEVLYRFVKNSTEMSLYNKKNESFLNFKHLNPKDILFDENVIQVSNESILFDFDYSEIEIDNITVIHFFDRSGLVLAVRNFDDGYELADDFKNLFNL